MQLWQLGPCGWKLAGPAVMGNSPGKHQTKKKQYTGLKIQKKLWPKGDTAMSGWACGVALHKLHTLTGVVVELLGADRHGRRCSKHCSAFISKLWFLPNRTAPIYHKGKQSTHILFYPPKQLSFVVYRPDEEVRMRSQSRNLFTLNMSAPWNTVFSQPMGREKNRYKFCQKKTKYLP